MMKFVKTIGIGLSRVFEKNTPDTGLVRMFETEYSHEYRQLRRHGVDVNESFVRDYLRTR